MSYILTLIADRTQTTLGEAVINRVREAVDGGPPRVLATGEAADIPCRNVPLAAALDAALEGAAIDTITTKPRNRRKGLLIADMDSTIVTSETLDEIAVYAGVGE